MVLPPSAVLELTYRCNHHCLFCSCPWYAPSSSYPVGDELSVDEWKKAVDRLYHLGIQSFSISGGEAILQAEGIPRCECGGVIRPNVVDGWMTAPHIQVSQVGYMPMQPKYAVAERLYFINAIRRFFKFSLKTPIPWASASSASSLRISRTTAGESRRTTPSSIASLWY